MTMDDRHAGPWPVPRAVAPASDTTASPAPAATVPLVAVAAGAGGLDALGIMMRGLPTELGLSFVLADRPVQHGPSPIPALLAERADLRVATLVGDTAPAPGTLYIAPPGRDVVVEEGRLRLRPPPPGREVPAPSADRLFETLARDRGSRAIGIVLSGNGTEGTYGVQAIREVGGVTLAQSPATARWEGMPAAAIETGCVDLQIPPSEMGAHLGRVAARDPERLDRVAARRGALAELMDLLLGRTGIDFRDYRDNTVRRRLARRMTALAIDDLDGYVAHCRADPSELEGLHRDLLISVTRFFRDGPAFAALGEALRDKLAKAPPDAPVRAWVAGCATGEEAYGVAMLILEALGGPEAASNRRVQVFATDIDDRALEVARRGLYPLSALDDVPEALAADYFAHRRGQVEVTAALRRIILFSHHNVFQDPPFLHLDLVTLRNVLIYFKAPLQDRVLARVHYALDPGGVLMLGASESVGGLPHRFETTPEGALFLRPPGPASSAAEMGLGAAAATASAETPDAEAAGPDGAALFEHLTRVIAPDGFVMDRGGRIVRVLGDISAVTGLSEAIAPALDASILRAPLREDVSRLVPIALRARSMREGQWHHLDGTSGEVRLDAYPIPDDDGALTRVLFALRRRSRPSRDEARRDAAYIEDLEGEVTATRSALRQTVEELRAFNEELQSVNEELQSSNEELQAVNEELETANEELQSTNEELITVNEEMQQGAIALRAAEADLDGVLGAMPVAVLLVDPDLRVRRASAAARRLFAIPRATGPVPLADCTVPDGLPLLTSFVRGAVAARSERVLRCWSDGVLRRLHVVPGGGTPGSALLIVNDADEADDTASDRAASHWTYDVETGRCIWSEGARRLIGGEADALPASPPEVWKRFSPGDRARLAAAFEDCRTKGRAYSLPVTLPGPDGSLVALRAEAVALRDPDGGIAAIVGSLRSG